MLLWVLQHMTTDNKQWLRVQAEKYKQPPRIVIRYLLHRHTTYNSQHFRLPSTSPHLHKIPCWQMPLSSESAPDWDNMTRKYSVRIHWHYSNYHKESPTNSRLSHNPTLRNSSKMLRLL